jgi:hypothetical protein
VSHTVINASVLLWQSANLGWFVSYVKGARVLASSVELLSCMFTVVSDRSAKPLRYRYQIGPRVWICALLTGSSCGHHNSVHTRAEIMAERMSVCDPTTSIPCTDQLSRCRGWGRGLDTGQNRSLSSLVHHDPTFTRMSQFLDQWPPLAPG